jgi:DNA-binding GntR family transcriptional regulator
VYNKVTVDGAVVIMEQKKRTLIPVREQLFEQIKELILTNAYEPDQIVQIEKLAEEFGVSTTPIREALIRLEGAGFLQMIPNKGVLISGIREEDIRNTWEMRRVLEPYAGRLAAELDLEQEIESLEGTLGAILAGAFDFEIYTRTDIQIHELFYTHLENDLLRETIQRVHQMSMRMRYFAENVSRKHDAVVEQVTTEHLAILKALRSHNPDQAAEAIYAHLINGEKRTLGTLTAKTAANIQE